MVLAVLCIVLVLTIIIGMPIAFGVGIASLAVLWLSEVPLVVLSQQIFKGLSSFTMMAIPLFVLAGNVMLQGRMTTTLLEVADLFVGRIRGGLGHVNIVVSMLFAGITGMATADTVAIGSVMIPTMVEKIYERDYSTAITIASSVIGPIIPPSLTLMIYHYFLSEKRNYEKREYHIPLREAFQIFKRGFLLYCYLLSSLAVYSQGYLQLRKQLVLGVYMH